MAERTTSHILLIVALALFTVSTLTTPTAATHSNTDYDLVFEGTFRLRFGAGPDLADELTFTGTGDGTPTGPSTINGLSYARSGPDGCATIVHDEVTIDSPDGRIDLENSGTDCVDLLSRPGRILIHGDGTTLVLGGNGHYTGSTGSGTWSVEAEVTRLGPGYAEGVFGPLRFIGAFDA